MNNRKTSLVSRLKEMFGELTGEDFASSDVHASFLNLGLDSLMLTQVSQSVQSKFGVKITFRQMMNDLASLDALAGFLDQKLPPEPVAAALPPPPVPAPVVAIKPTPEARTIAALPVVAKTVPSESRINGFRGSANPSAVERVVQQQLQVMAQQLEMLRRSGAASTPDQPSPQAIAAKPADPTAPSTIEPRATRAVVKALKNEGEDNKRFGPFKGIERGPTGGLTPRQEKALAELVARYNQRTSGSKLLAQQHREHFCDPRAAGNFRQLWKEMVYPLGCARSLGSRIWDIDGNEYIDVTMGFGANYLGHSPEFVVRAVDEQLKLGFEIGPQSPLAGENAKLVCELTGMERATFCNTGSEAVTAALRVARTVTGRDKFVFFRGDYHGIADEVLAKPALVDGMPGAMPIAPGIPHLAHVIVLEYGNPASLETIKAHANDIAAVIVEPVQARHPGIIPREFLKELRRVTEDGGIALIFDEVITGFRIALGGAQEYFGVKADLATYGKVIGGGMPMGVLAGKAKFMDVLDGGQWRYGDDSFPEVGVTFFAGTFVRHPLAMAAANAALKHLKNAGPALQNATNALTTRFADRVNTFFGERGLPMRLLPFSAFFFYDFHPDLSYAGLLFYYLRDRGVHIWEGRVCHLSTAHTQEDMDFVFNALKESVLEMQEAGFLPTGPTQDDQSPESDVRPPQQDHAGESANASSEFPLTAAQSEMWIAAQMRPEASGSHNGSNVLELSGPLDVDALKKAIAEIIIRHEALRSTFSADGTRVVVAPDLAFELPVHELSRYSESDQKLRVAEILKIDGQRIFDLVKGPLFSFQLIHLSATDHWLVFTVQMIICDGWSYNIVLEDLSALYSAFVEGRKPMLAPATPMRGYVQWQQQPERVEEVRNCETYWLSQFKTLPAPLDLPTFKSRPATRSFDGDRECLRLSAELFKSVKRVAKELGSTPFALLLSAYQNWLYRLSGLDDLVIGIPFGGQGFAGLDTLVGQCVHTLPMRFKIAPEEPFTGLLSKTRELIIDAQENWNYSFGTLAQKIELPRDPSRVPVVSVLFNLDPSLNKVQFARCKQRITAAPRYYFQYDLGFNLVDEGTTLLVECDFNRNLFDAETVRRWLNHFNTLLQSIISDPAQDLNRLAMLDEVEKRKLSVEWNATDREFPRNVTVHELVSAQADRTPSAIALEFDGQVLTYAELEQRSNQLGRHLAGLGVGPDILVGVCLKRSIDMIVGVLGVLKAGGAYVPIDPDLPADRMAYILDDAAAPVLLTHGSLLSQLPQTKAQLVCLDEDTDAIGKEEATPVPARSHAENLAYVIYTSGSTGRPKGVELQHRGFVSFLFSMRREPGLSPQDIMLGLTTLSFDIAGLEIFLPLIVGARTVIVDREVSMDPHRLSETIIRSGITVAQATPATWRMLVNSGWQGRQTLKVLCGGEAMPNDLAERLMGTCGELWNMYGPTETTVWSTVRRLTSGCPINIGRPIDNTKIHIVDPLLQPVPIGVPGELLIGGVGLARSYHNRPELTAEKFIKDPFSTESNARLYRTGDLARYLANGEVEFIGRRDFQVKLRGYRIELGEIESILFHHDKVREAVAVVREDSPDHPRLIAYVVIGVGADKPEAESLAGLRSELRQLIRRKLPDYMVPSAFVIVDALPLTPQQKVDRLALPPPPPASFEASDDYVAPENAIEKSLARIWAETLKLKQVGIKDNFFDLGGQSLLAVSLFAKIESEFGKKLPLATLFKAPTIEQMAALVSSDADAEAATWSSLVPVQPKGTRAPLFLIHGAGGNVLLYQWLAQYLAPDHPLYGLQSRGLDGKSTPLTTIEEMAVEYLKEVRATQPHGPYYLGGYCLGGTIAYEMAQRLRQAGEEVALVAMLDTYNFSRALKSSFAGYLFEKIKFHFGNFVRLRPSEMFKYIKEKIRVARDGELANLLTSQPGSSNEPGVSRAESGIEASVQAINDHAADHYLPQPYHGRLTLFKPRVNYKIYPDPKMGWGDLSLDGLDIVELPVNPHAMLVEPYVRLLAAELKARLEPAKTEPAASFSTEKPNDHESAPVLAHR